LWPHPTLSKGEGLKKDWILKKSEAKVLSFGEDLGEAKRIFVDNIKLIWLFLISF